MGRRLKPSVKKKRSSRKSSKSRLVRTRKMLEALSLSMEPTTAKVHPNGEPAAPKSGKVDLRKLLEDLEVSMERFKHHPDAVQRTDSETLRLPGDDILCGDWGASDSDIGEDCWDINGPFELLPFEVEQLSMEPTTATDHPGGERAARKSSKVDLRMLQEDLELSIEEIEEIEEQTTVEVKDHPNAVQQTDVSKPCCGDGGRQEIKDSSNTSRKQSISDDIISGDEDVDSETLSSSRDNLPWHILWGDPGEDIDSDISGDYGGIYGPFEPMRLEWEENWGNLDVKNYALPVGQDFMSGIKHNCMPVFPPPEYI